MPAKDTQPRPSPPESSASTATPPQDETGGPRKARTRQPRKCPAPVARKSHRPLANSTGAASTGCALDYAVLILQSIEYGLPIAEDDPRPAEGSSGAHGAGPRTRRSPRRSRTATARPPPSSAAPSKSPQSTASAGAACGRPIHRKPPKPASRSPIGPTRKHPGPPAAAKERPLAGTRLTEATRQQAKIQKYAHMVRSLNPRHQR